MKIEKLCKKGILVLAIGLLGLWSYGNVYTTNGYLRMVKSADSNYLKSRNFNGVSLELLYTPPRYMASLQKNKAGLEDVDLGEVITEFENTSDYILRIESLNTSTLLKSIVGDMTTYQELVHYLSFDIKSDISLQLGEQQVSCSFAHFERNFDTAPIAHIQVGFQLDDIQKQKMKSADNWSVRFDAERFGLGPVYFNYERSNLKTPIYIL